jgi:ribosomal protein S12 methylthiotransferase accessory factor
MGKYIKKTRFGERPISDLYNTNSGMIDLQTTMENSLADPDIFTHVASCCDIAAIGMPFSHASNGSGAGLTFESAYYAAIGEAVERYCLAVFHPEDLLLTTCKELKKQKLQFVGPEKWSLFNNEQHIGHFDRFNEKTLIAWAQADSLIDEVTKYVPASLVYLPYGPVFKAENEEMISVSISTGASCATSVPEAIFKGICELIERDAFMIMWKNQLSPVKIDIDQNSELYEVYNTKFKRPGIKFDLYYTTQDLEMPSFFGVLTDTRKGYAARVVGGAAHPDPTVAALKTLIELVQGLFWMEYKGDVSFPVEEGFLNVDSFEKRMELYAYNDMSEALKFLPEDTSMNLSDIKKSYGYNNRNIKFTLRNIIEEFRKRQYDILAVDTTTPDAYSCGLNVVKVLIPALEVMEGDFNYQFLGGKRWKEVPPKLGLKKFDPDITLNPFPHPYP